MKRRISLLIVALIAQGLYSTIALAGKVGKQTKKTWNGWGKNTPTETTKESPATTSAEQALVAPSKDVVVDIQEDTKSETGSIVEHDIEQTEPETEQSETAQQEEAVFTQLSWNSAKTDYEPAQAVLPTQVMWPRKVNYQSIADEIKLLKKENITSENQTTYRHKVENAIRDLLGDLNAAFSSGGHRIEIATGSEVLVRLLDELARNSNDLGIIGENDKIQVISWINKYNETINKFDTASREDYANFRKDLDVSSLIVALGFENDIDEAIHELQHLAPDSITKKRTMIENQVNSMLSVLTAQMNSTENNDQAVGYAEKIQAILEAAQQRNIGVGLHQMNDATAAIQSSDTAIAHKLKKDVNNALRLRKLNKAARKQLHKTSTTRYKTEGTEDLSDTEYEQDDLTSARYMLDNLALESDK